jgi:hypothetical protein
VFRATGSQRVPAQDAHEARTDLIGGATTWTAILAQAITLKAPASGRNTGATQFALSLGLTAHGRESGMRIARA